MRVEESVYQPGRRRARRRLLGVFALALAGRAARARASPVGLPAEVGQALGPEARLLGQAQLRMLGFAIYGARLWVGAGFNPTRFESSSLALELDYARSFAGHAIAQRSLDEMQRAGALAQSDSRRWLGFMTEAFPDVKAGDRLCGLWTAPEGRTSFFSNGLHRASLVDSAFGRRFFGIWLAEHSSQPQMRLALLGQTPP